MPYTFPFDLGQGGADRPQRLLHLVVDFLMAPAILCLHGSELSRQRRALRDLDDRLLADIGFTRAAAEREAGKWFWR